MHVSTAIAMGFGRIHDLPGRYIDGKFRAPKTFEAAEKHIWSELFNGFSEEVR